jgi:hypothetical protein
MSPSKSKGNKRWYNYNDRKPNDFDEEEVEDEGEAGGHKKMRGDQGYLGNHFVTKYIFLQSVILNFLIIFYRFTCICYSRFSKDR